MVEIGMGSSFSEIHPDYYQIPVADKEQLLAEQIVEQENDNSEQDQEEPYSDRSSDSLDQERGGYGGDGIDEVEARRQIRHLGVTKYKKLLSEAKFYRSGGERRTR